MYRSRRTRGMQSRAALLASAALVATVGIQAQSVTQGAITGTVQDVTGASIPKATVTITNKATNATLNLTTDDSGFFNAPLLQPGTYRVRVEAQGFGAYETDNVSVDVSRATTVEPKLKTGTAETTVDVTETTPIVETENPDFSNLLTGREIQDAPQNNRRWSSLALLTPGVVSDANGFGLVAVRGISPLFNDILIDGADDNQAFFSEERGRTREAYSTSEDAVREFQVNAGVYQAEFGRAAGAVINSVTVSGGNQLHGEAYIYDRNSGWNAFTPGVSDTTATANPAGGYTFASFPIKPKDLRKIYGFSVGGHLIKDRLFWHYVYDQQTRIFPGIAKPASPNTFFNLPTAASGLGANEICNLTTGYLSPNAADKNYTLNSQVCALSAREGLTSYQAGVNNYDAGLASLLPDLGLVPRTGYQEINTPKLDYTLSSKEHLSLLYHRLRWDSPGGVQTQATVPYSIDAFGNDFVKLDYGLAKLESQILPNVSNEIGYQYSRELDYETQQPFSQYTLNNLWFSGTTANGVPYTKNVPYVNLATSSGFNLGSPYYSYRTSYPDERKWQIFDTAYWIKGNHTIKFGGDALHNYDLINNTYESNGDFSYNYISNYFVDLYNRQNNRAASCTSNSSATATATASAVGKYPCFTNYYQGFGNPLYDIATLDYSAFVQDNWKVTPRLTLELGVRYDYEFLPFPSQNLVTAAGNFSPYPGITNRPSDKNNVGPRLGFAYDVFGNQKTVLRGGYGIFYGRILNGTAESVFLNTGSPNGQTTPLYKPSTPGAPLLPALATAQAAGSLTSYYFASNFQNPQVHEWDLILQQQLSRNIVANVEYLGSGARQLPNFLNLNLNNNPYSATNTGGFTIDTITIAPDTTGRSPLAPGSTVQVKEYNGYGNTALFGPNATKFQNITQVTSNVNASYNAFVAQVASQNYHGLDVNLSYTWSHALDYGQNASTQTSTNSWFDPFGSPLANYGNSSYNVPNRFTGFVMYTFPNVNTGSALKYVTNGWRVSDDVQMQNGLPYTVGTSGYVGNGAVSGPNGSGGGAYFPQIGRNTLQFQRDIVDDVRLTKAIPFTERYNLELRADLFNAANHQNVSSVASTAYLLTSTGATTGQAAFQPNFGSATQTNASGFLYTPREIQVSARFLF